MFENVREIRDFFREREREREKEKSKKKDN